MGKWKENHKTEHMYLSQYHKFDVILKNTNELIEQIWTRATKTTQIMSDMPKGSGAEDKIAKAIVEIVSIQDEFAKDAGDAARKALEIYRIINKVENPIYHEILWKRYLQFKPDYEIAKEMNYEVRTINNLFFQALDEVKKIRGN